MFYVSVNNLAAMYMFHCTQQCFHVFTNFSHCHITHIILFIHTETELDDNDNLLLLQQNIRVQSSLKNSKALRNRNDTVLITPQSSFNRHTLQHSSKSSV